MTEFLQWLSSGSIYATILVVVFLVLTSIIILIYLIAFFQGREISFWPPKIGEKPAATNKLDRTKAIVEEKKHGIKPRIPIIKDIVIVPIAEKDCDTFDISLNELKEFIAGEAENHPQMFGNSFTSLPLVFLRFVLILSWDGSNVIVERVLNREQAYPLNDMWTSCLSLYRQATILPYRTASYEEVVLSTLDSKRTVQLYRKLIKLIESYSKLIESIQMEHDIDIKNLEVLLDEAEFALAENQVPLSVTRFEALLSTVHKILLKYAPQATITQKEIVHTLPTFKPMYDDDFSILIVDDIADWRETLGGILVDEGFQVQTVGNGIEAMQAMVEHDYDVVVTDLRLSETDEYNQDGREVSIAAKKSNPKTKIVLITGYSVMATKTEMLHYDGFFAKGELFGSDFIGLLKEFAKHNKAG